MSHASGRFCIDAWAGKRERVQRWDPLSSRQLDLLRRIVGGDDLSGQDGVEHRRSGRALHDRGLVAVTRKGGVWRAHPTDAGRFYLEHGHHPDRPDDRSRGTAGGASPVTPNDVVAMPPEMLRRVRELVDRLQRQGGTIRVERPDDETRALYRRVIHAAKQHDAVPAGHHLRHTGRDSGDIVIRLYPDTEPDDTDWNRIRLNTRRVTTNPDRVFGALEADPAYLAVSPQSLPRALQLIRLLADEVGRRGHRIGVNTRTKHPRLYLQAGQTRRTVTVAEEYDRVPHKLTPEERKISRLRPWMAPAEFDTVASGRLRLEIARAGSDKHDSWTDTDRLPLERRLTSIVRDFEAGLAADEEARLESVRAWGKQRAEHSRLEDERRLQEEQTRARWRDALSDARGRAVDMLRADTFRQAYHAWTAAAEIRAFCTALDQAAERADADSGDVTNLARWVAWGRAAADRMDPIVGARPLADVDYDPEPAADHLRPFLGEWSPHRPVKDYRSAEEQQRLDDIRRHAESWRCGLLGRDPRP